MAGLVEDEPLFKQKCHISRSGKSQNFVKGIDEFVNVARTCGSFFFNMERL